MPTKCGPEAGHLEDHANPRRLMDRRTKCNARASRDESRRHLRPLAERVGRLAGIPRNADSV